MKIRPKTMTLQIAAYECPVCGQVWPLSEEDARKCAESHVVPKHVARIKYRTGEKVPVKVVLMDGTGENMYLYNLCRKINPEEEDW